MNKLRYFLDIDYEEASKKYRNLFKHFKIKDKEIILRTELRGKCHKAFKVVGMSPPEKILSMNKTVLMNPINSPINKQIDIQDVVTTP